MKSLEWNTKVSFETHDWKITQRSNILTVGSCFAEVLGSQLDSYKFSVLNNPFGTVFNPLSIAKLIDLALDGKVPNAGLYHQNADNIWLHHDFHSSFWATSREALEAKLIGKLREVGQFIRNTDVLVLTFGTAYAYRHRTTNILVGNCHKVPADRFVKELLHIDQINISLEQILFKLQSLRRDLKVILTVSPVRHTKDTLSLNQVSKSTLRLVCHRLSEKFRQVEYFPAYEIMIDELRDYRFYKSDLIHPNSVAEDYIFRTFADELIDIPALEFIREWDGILKMINHRPQHGLTESHFTLLNNLQNKLDALSAVTDVSEELAVIKRRISEFPARG